MLEISVLSLGIDGDVLSSHSSVFRRLVGYSSLVKKYGVLVPSKKNIKISDGNLRVYGVGSKTKISALFNIYKRASFIIRTEGYNVITTQDPFELALVGWLLKLRYHVGLNLQEHGDVFFNEYWKRECFRNCFRYRLGLFLLQRADSIRVVSKRIKRKLVEFGIREDKIVTVPVFVAKEKNENVNEVRNKHKGKFIFLSIGRFVKQKNLPLLIRSFKTVHEKYNNCVLVLVGRGPEKKNIQKLVKQMGLTDVVDFYEWTDDVYSFYNAADAYVLSSNYEGWGMVIIEAASIGLPIIMTDTGCANEIIKDDESGFVIPVGDSLGLSHAMGRLVGGGDFVEKLTIGAKDVAKKLLTKKETLELYKKSWELAAPNRTYE